MMRVSFWFFGLLFWMAALSPFGALCTEFFQPYEPARTLQVMAHRGNAVAAPENTLHALQGAAQLGFEWVEIDVRLTRDGRHVLFHDSEVDAKTDGSGRVKDLTLDEIKQLDAGEWFAPRFRGTRILTLAEALAWAKGKVNLYLDCKDVDPVLLANEILAASMQEQCSINAGRDVLAAVRDANPDRIRLMAKCHSVDGLDELVEEYDISIVEINVEDLSESLVRAAHEKGVLTQVKALDNDDNEGVWKRAVELGMDFVQTDRAAEMQAVYFRKQCGGQARCRVAAHRGSSSLAPENTLASIESAIALGCDFVEVDVRTTRDGELMIMHDRTVDKTTGKTGAFNQYTMQQLKTFNAGAWFGLLYKDEVVPTFDEVLELMKGKIGLYLDWKDADAGELLKRLEKHGMVASTVVYGGPDELQALGELNPDIRLMPPLRSIDGIEPALQRFQPYAFDVAWESLSPELIERCHAHGIEVFSDAIGEHETIEEYSKAIEWGVDLIQTDYPSLVQRAIETYCSNQ